MQSLTYIKNLRISPKKLRFMLYEIKKHTPVKVLPILQYTTKKGARILYKAIKSSIVSAKTALKIDENLLKFKVLTVEEGQKQRRWRAGGRGTVAPFKRKLAHIKIILEAENIKPKVEEKALPKVINKKAEIKSSKVKTQSAKPNVKTVERIKKQEL